MQRRTAFPSIGAGAGPIYAALAVVVVAATILRLDGLGFGLPALYDPDEPLFVLSALRLLRDGTFNPGWFGHPGSTTIYTLALIDIVVLGLGLATGRFADPKAIGVAIYQDPGVVFMPGRSFMLVCGLVTILLTFVLARRLFGARVALLAAVLLALDPVHIRYSQIIRTDMHATIFMLLCLFATVAIVQQGRLRSYLWAGVWVGIGCATKWPAGTAAVAICGAAVARMIETGEVTRQMRYLAAAFVAAVTALVVASPYLAIDYTTVLTNLGGEARSHHPGATGFGLFGNALWYVRQPLLAAFGLAGLGLAAVGLVAATRASRAFAFTALPMTLVFFVEISTQALIWERWVVPMLPILTIGAAFAIVALGQWIGRRLGRRAAWAAAVAATLAVALPTLGNARADARERHNDTRRLASAWALAHIPRGSTILIEPLAFDLFDEDYDFLYPAGGGGCVDGKRYMRGEIPYAQVSRWQGKRAVIDLGTVAPEMLHTCAADYAIVTNYDRYLLEPATYPGELASYVRALGDDAPTVMFGPVRGKVGGPVVRIVRPVGGRARVIPMVAGTPSR